MAIHMFIIEDLDEERRPIRGISAEKDERTFWLIDNISVHPHLMIELLAHHVWRQRSDERSRDSSKPAARVFDS